jgi:hypothetical protein
VTDQPSRKPIQYGRTARLRELGYDEIWLQNWLSASPQRLGIGPVTILAQELNHPRGGSLDILAADEDTYYSVEVQLGEIDASHGFRVFDYWAKNRIRYPGKTHVAVLVAESAGGRYRPALEALAEFLPLIVVELRAWIGENEVIIVPEVVIADERLSVGPGVATAGSERSEEDWREELSGESWEFHREFVDWASEHLGEVRVDYSPKSYVGIRRGRRVWAPLWPRKDGATVYLPDPDGSRSDEPSVAFEHFSDQLKPVGIEPSWQTTYNAGSNPISVRLRRPDLERQQVQDLLRASFEILADGATAWSDAHTEALSAADGGSVASDAAPSSPPDPQSLDN